MAKATTASVRTIALTLGVGAIVSFLGIRLSDGDINQLVAAIEERLGGSVVGTDSQGGGTVASTPIPSGAAVEAQVARVVDGDTIELTSGQRVRYIGVNTPETVDPNRGAECFGAEASAENKRLVEGKTVRLVKDVSETDRYGRLLRYVYVGDVMVNEQLVAGGYARSSSYPPDVRYQSLFRTVESQARMGGNGLWSSCPAAK